MKLRQKIKQLTKEQHEAICEWIKGNCYTGGLETEEEMNFLVTRFTNQFPPEPIENQTKTESSLYDIYIENGTACEEALKRIKIKWKKPKA